MNEGISGAGLRLAVPPPGQFSTRYGKASVIRWSREFPELGRIQKGQLRNVEVVSHLPVPR